MIDSELKYIEKRKELISVLLLIAPMISRWIFPMGMEDRFTIKIFDYYPFYLIDLCYFIFPFYANFKPCTKNTHKVAAALLTIQFIFTICGVFLNDYSSDRRFVFWGNYAYFFAMFYALYYPLSSYQIHIMRLPLAITLGLLTIEIIIYSTGMASYSEDILDDAYSSSISRISTTIGVATATSVVMFMLGGLTFCLYQKFPALIKYGILFLWVISVLITLSRGAMGAIFIYLLYYFYNELRSSQEKGKTLIKLLFLFIALGIFLYSKGVFDAISERTATGQASDESREANLRYTLDNLRFNPVWGVGFGNIYCADELRFTNSFFSRFSNNAPHNFYVVVLVEQGIAGLVLFLSFFFTLLRKLPFLTSDLCVILLLTLLIPFNTETVFVNDQYIFLFALILNICLHHPLDIDKDEEAY